MIAKEMKLGGLGAAAWSAAGGRRAAGGGGALCGGSLPRSCTSNTTGMCCCPGRVPTCLTHSQQPTPPHPLAHPSPIQASTTCAACAASPGWTPASDASSCRAPLTARSARATWIASRSRWGEERSGGQEGGQCAAGGAGMQGMCNEMRQFEQSHAAVCLCSQTKHQLLPTGGPPLHRGRHPQGIWCASQQACRPPQLKALAHLQQRPSRPPVV